MTRATAIAAAEAYFDEGGFAADLARRVAIPTESQVEERAPALHAYLADEIAPSLARLGFVSEIVPNPVKGGPMLLAERREEGARTTVFGYGHGDVIRGLELQWHEGLSPWTLTPRGERLYRPRHRRQQGPAHDQSGGDGMRAENPRPSRLQRQVPGRDRRGDRLARPARSVPAIQGQARRRRADRLGRAAPRAGPADDLSRHPRRDEFRPDRGFARGRPPFRELGRAPRQPRHRPRPRAGDDHRREGRDPGARMGAAAPAEFGARCARRLHRRRRRGGAGDGPGLGRAGPVAGREGVWLVQLRGAGLPYRQSGKPGQRDPAARQGDLPDPLRGRGR